MKRRNKQSTSVVQDDNNDDDMDVITTQMLFAAVETHGKRASYTADGTPYSVKPLVELFATAQGNSSTLKKASCLSLVEGFSKSQARRFFDAVKGILTCVLFEEDYILEDDDDDDDDDDEGMDHDQGGLSNASSTAQNKQNGSNNRSTSSNSITTKSTATDRAEEMKTLEALRFIQIVAVCVETYLNAKWEASQNAASSGKGNSTSSVVGMVTEAYLVAVELHDVLLHLSNCGDPATQARDAVLSLCEAWWHAGGHERETLIVQCLPLLVHQSLESEASKKSQAKRLFQLREAFHVVDFSDPDSDSLRGLLLRMVSNPLCLKSPEGKQFLSILLLDSVLMQDLHSAICGQLPEANKKILAVYGEVYFRAWKEALNMETEEQRNALEIEVLQDLVHTAIHVGSDASFQRLMTLLGPIHESKKANNVQGLLYRLYSPIMWRSLSAANHRVRINTLRVLACVFPLQDPENSRTVDAVSKCTEALKVALLDADPRVRVAASATTGTICTVFWAALPASDIRELLNVVIIKHSSDKKSAAVRRAAVTTVQMLLDIPESKAVLRPLLPCVGNLIHDTSQSVRLAVVHLLCRLKTVKSIKFYHVVPVDQLVIRLSEEERLQHALRNPVASALSSLLLKSYFPQGSRVSATDQLKRALTFMASTPKSATVFFANIAEHLSESAILKLAMMLFKCLESSVQMEVQQRELDVSSQRSNKRSRSRTTQDEMDTSNDGKTEGALSASNTTLMATISEVLHRLLESIRKGSSSRDNTGDGVDDDTARLIDTFNIDTWSGIFTYFYDEADTLQKSKRKKGAKGNSNDAKSKTECLQVCSFLIACLTELPIQGSDQFTTIMAKKVAPSLERSSQTVLLPYVLLLCKSDKTNDVVDGLKESIGNLWNGDLCIDLQSPRLPLAEHGGMRMDGIDEDDPDAEKVRKQEGRSSDPSIALLRSMPCRGAVKLVHTILGSSDPICEEIRRHILASSDASEQLKDSLDTTMKSLKNLLTFDDFDVDLSRHSKNELLLVTWECCGRFLLHRMMSNTSPPNKPITNTAGTAQIDANANANTNTGMQVNSAANRDSDSDSELKAFCTWTLENIVAHLNCDKMDSDLCNLDLSRISNASESLVILTSPTAQSCAGHSAGDWNVAGKKAKAKEGHNKENSYDSDAKSTRADTKGEPHPLSSSSKIAGVVLYSMCLLLAEFLVVDLSEGPYQWFVAPLIDFGRSLIVDEGKLNGVLRSNLLDAYTRLSYQLCKKGDHSLLEWVLEQCSPAEKSTNKLRKAVSLLTSKRSKCSVAVAQTILRVAKASLPQPMADVMQRETWEDETNLVADAMDVLLVHGHGNVLTALQHAEVA